MFLYNNEEYTSQIKSNTQEIIMKILFLQISDMHCVESDNNNYVKMGAVTNATRSLGKIDGIVVIFFR